jgi:hypothetical protein
LSELSNVEPIGHPLARSINHQSLTTAADQRVRARFDPELSKILADEALPQPAFHQPGVIAAAGGDETEFENKKGTGGRARLLLGLDLLLLACRRADAA